MRQEAATTAEHHQVLFCAGEIRSRAKYVRGAWSRRFWPRRDVNDLQLRLRLRLRLRTRLDSTRLASTRLQTPNCSFSYDSNNFAYFLRLQIVGNMLVNVPLSDCLDRPLSLPPSQSLSLPLCGVQKPGSDSTTTTQNGKTEVKNMTWLFIVEVLQCKKQKQTELST